MTTIRSIDEVITILEGIVQESKKHNDPLGYFAALYKKVTVKVKTGIADHYFDDGPRMEQLDIIFASRYIDAYRAFKQHESVTHSWQKAFELSRFYWPIVLQHLLIGMNAHINLDLGIAAAEVMADKPINDLKNDFNKINGILSDLVHDVESDLAKIWPTLKKLLTWTGKVDNLLIDFSMELARDGAWKFAVAFANTPKEHQPALIQSRDHKVSETGLLITNPGWFASLLFKIIRLGERGSVADKIDDLND